VPDVLSTESLSTESRITEVPTTTSPFKTLRSALRDLVFVDHGRRANPLRPKPWGGSHAHCEAVSELALSPAGPGAFLGVNALGCRGPGGAGPLEGRSGTRRARRCLRREETGAKVIEPEPGSGQGEPESGPRSEPLQPNEEAGKKEE